MRSCDPQEMSLTHHLQSLHLHLDLVLSVLHLPLMHLNRPCWERASSFRSNGVCFRVFEIIISFFILASFLLSTPTDSLNLQTLVA